MAERKRTTAQQAIDFIEIETLALQGKNQREIAEILSQSRSYTLSRQQVQYDISKLEKIWLEESKAEIDLAKGRILAEIRNLQNEYWDAWHRSQENAEKEIKKQRAIPGKTKKGASVVNQEVQKISEGQTGDPRFLTGIQWCIERRCLILGVDAPKKTALTDPSGNNPASLIDHEGFDRSMRTLADAITSLIERDDSPDKTSGS